MITIGKKSTRTEEFSGGKFGALSLTASAIMTATNADFPDDALNLDDIFIKLELFRNGKKHTICDNQFKPLAFWASLTNSNFESVSPKLREMEQWQIMRNKAVGVSLIGQKSFIIPFGGVVDLRGSDVIKVTVITDANLFASELDQQNSLLSVDLIVVEGEEQYLPMIEVDTIPEKESSPTYSVEGICTSLAFVNTDLQGQDLANQVIQSMSVDSDQIKRTLNIDQMIALRNQDFLQLAEAEDRCMTFELIKFNPNKLYTRVRVRPTLRQALVNGGSNFWVSTRAVWTETSQVRSNQTKQDLITNIKPIIAQSMESNAL